MNFQPQPQSQSQQEEPLTFVDYIISPVLRYPKVMVVAALASIGAGYLAMQYVKEAKLEQKGTIEVKAEDMPATPNLDSL